MNLKERNENIREFFNNKVESYDEVHLKYFKTKAQITENLKEEPEKVLDLGCGTGLELIPLFKKYPNVYVTAIDITENMIESLKKREFIDHVIPICGDFFEVDFQEDFDAIISTSALHHFLKEDKSMLYKKIYNSLKKKGEFINSDKIAKNTKEEKELIKEYEEYKYTRAHIDTPLSIKTEEKLLKKAGFKKIKIILADAADYRIIKATK